MKIVAWLLSLLRQHKFKLVLMILSTLFFALTQFPFQDLSDLASGKIAQLTGNQLFVQFRDLKLKLLPGPSVQLDQVSVETPQTPTLTIQQLVASPSLLSFLTKSPAGKLSAKGVFHGDLEVAVKSGPNERQRIEIQAKHLSLNELREFIDLPVVVKGQLDVQSVALADLTFQEQPEMDLVVKIDKLEFPSSLVQTPMGPLNLPELKISSVELKGRLIGGKFNVEEGLIGKDNDELHGTVTGDISLTLQNRGGLSPTVGAYNFNINFQVKKSLESRANLFLTLIDQYKSPTSEGSQYSFHLSATNPNLPPNLSALR